MQTKGISRYYDRNTWRFLRLGGGGEAAAIHRAIWAPDVSGRHEAFEYLNRATGDAIRPALLLQNPPELLDLGCGVGGTATYLARALGAQVTGVTLSRVQRSLAEQRAKRLGLSDRCRFIEANFMELPPGGPVCAGYAIEAFVHAPAGDEFFRQAAARLLPRGRLVLCDDFLDERVPGLPAGHPAWAMLRRFSRGWHIHTLAAPSQAAKMAESAGLRLLERTDLTRYIRFFHPTVLKLVHLLTRIPLPGSYWQNLAGGSALQICIRSGWTRYQMMVFSKD